MIDSLELQRELLAVIHSAQDNAPRSLQKSIGPSEVGTPCVRRIGYRLAEVEEVNRPDSWLATIGTAVHTWLAESFNATGIEDYLVENRVQVSDELAGSVDLYIRDKKLILDWKIVGETALAKYKRQGPGEQYRTQVHLYGMGYRNAGHEVEHVGIAFLPRGGSLRGMHIWAEPYQEAIANAGIERLQLAKSVIANGGSKNLNLLPAVEANCHYCPYFLPASTNLAVGCPGPDSKPNPTN